MAYYNQEPANGRKIIPGLGAAKDTELFNLSKLSLELHWLPQFGSFNLAPPVLEIF